MVTPRTVLPRGAVPVVYIVDDDISMREALTDLFESVSIKAEAFESTTAFLASARPGSGCILLDVRLPDLNGLDLQAHLNAKGNKMPIIFMTGFGDIPMSVKAIKAGASDFLTKPFSHNDLLDAVYVALARDAETRKGEPPRLCRRPQLVRSRVYDKQDDEQILS